MRFSKHNPPYRTADKKISANPDQTIRAFFAIDFDPPVKDQLQKIQDLLKPPFSGHRVNWVQPDHIHLTLRFLGNILPVQLPQIIENCGFISSYHPLSLTLSGFGCFPSMEKPRVIWMGCRCPDEMFVLQKRIETAVRSIGLDPDDKIFSPHLTLGRIRDFVQPKNAPHHFDLKKALLEINSSGMEITQLALGIRLYQSRLSSRGATYTVLHDFLFSE